MTDKKTQIFSKLAVIGLWTLLLVGTITNGMDVLGKLLIGSTLDTLTSIIKNLSMVILSLSLVPIFLKEKKLIVFTLLLFGVIWYWSSQTSIYNTPFLIENFQAFFIEALPYLWFFAYFLESDNNDCKSFYVLLYKICRVKLIIALSSQIIMFISPQTDIFFDYMDAANALLLGLLVIVSSNLLNHHSNKIDNVLELLSIASIVVLGSRGGVMCYAAFYILYFLFFAKNNHKGFIILLCCVGLILLYQLMPLFLKVFAGSENRLVEKLSSNTFVHDENRALIYAILLSDFGSNPLGMGVMADREILTTSTEIWEVFYAHNLFLEMLVDFGYIGVVLSIILIIWMIKCLRRGLGYTKLILCVLISCSFIKLMVSSSLWKDQIFWAMIGCMWIVYQRTRKTNAYGE